MPKKLSLDQKKEIANFYKTKVMTMEELSNHFSISIPTAEHILDMFNIKRYGKAVLFSPNLNVHYFDNIDDPQKAYWLGFLMADGCIHVKKSGKKILAIELKREDEYLLADFLNDICSNKKIVHRDKRKTSYVQIQSDEICDSLSAYGIIPQKTGKEKFICPAYKEAYIHGIIDGDGSIGYYSRKDRPSHSKSIRLCCSNRLMLESIVEWVGCGRIEKSHEGLDTITWNSDDAMMRIISIVNKYSTSCLKRKMIIMDKIRLEILESGKYRDNCYSAVS